jgi:hypothetical protein
MQWASAFASIGHLIVPNNDALINVIIFNVTERQKVIKIMFNVDQSRDERREWRKFRQRLFICQYLSIETDMARTGRVG